MRDPDTAGMHGRAWKAPATEETRIRWPAGLDSWLLHCPGAHPFWAWYAVTSCSLADIPGLPPANRHSPDMTHELQVSALHPNYQPDETWCTDGPGRWAAHRLTPMNLVEQIPAFTDELHSELVLLVVRSFCDGMLSPDTDWRTAQRDAIHATAAHLRAGRHVPS